MFCWYTAYISILFLCIFVLVEFVDYVAEQGFSRKLMLDRAPCPRAAPFWHSAPY